jgi:alanine racemase
MNNIHQNLLDTLDNTIYSSALIDLQAVASNYKKLVNISKSGQCAAVIKADAYGLGAEALTPTIANQGCQTFFTAYIDEGISLRKTLKQMNHNARIYVLNGFFPKCESLFVEHDLTPVLCTVEQIHLWQAHARTLNRPLAAALHVDTGMRRTGIPYHDFWNLIDTPDTFQGIALSLIISHLACSDHLNHPHNERQLEKAKKIHERLPTVPFSLSNSGGIFLSSDYHFNLTRSGMAIYGMNPTPYKENSMAPVLSLWSRIYQVQDVNEGQSIGYGQSYYTQAPAKIATLALGYADGYPWQATPESSVMISGYPARIVGRISMDLMTVDVTNIPNHLVVPGAWAQVVGDHLSIDEIAKMSKTIPYEVLLGLGKRFHRVYTKSLNKIDEEIRA